MTLREADGKAVKIMLKDGSSIEGWAYDYTSALDNEPEPASITINHTEIYETDIESIMLK